MLNISCSLSNIVLKVKNRRWHEYIFAPPWSQKFLSQNIVCLGPSVCSFIGFLKDSKYFCNQWVVAEDPGQEDRRSWYPEQSIGWRHTDCKAIAKFYCRKYTPWGRRSELWARWPKSSTCGCKLRTDRNSIATQVSWFSFNYLPSKTSLCPLKPRILGEVTVPYLEFMLI